MALFSLFQGGGEEGATEKDQKIEKRPKIALWRGGGGGGGGGHAPLPTLMVVKRHKHTYLNLYSLKGKLKLFKSKQTNKLL